LFNAISANIFRPRSRVRINLPGTPETPRGFKPVRKALTHIPDLCKSLGNTQAPRLSLNIESGKIFQHVESVLEPQPTSERESTSLSDGYLHNHTELSINGKICLALVLSYALLDFCGKPWFPGGWTRDGICFLQHGAYLSLLPTLITSIRDTSDTAQKHETSSDMKLLLHGILLMEVFQQVELRINLKDILVEEIDKTRSFALKEFAKLDWGVCERYRIAVEACLEGSKVIEDFESTEDEIFVKAFCQSVIAPLQSDYKSQWRDQDPDEVISELKLPKVECKKPPRPGPKPAQFQLSKQKVTITTPLKLFNTFESPEITQYVIAYRIHDSDAYLNLLTNI
jgi:hypothetical protein